MVELPVIAIEDPADGGQPSPGRRSPDRRRLPVGGVHLVQRGDPTPRRPRCRRRARPGPVGGRGCAARPVPCRRAASSPTWSREASVSDALAEAFPLPARTTGSCDEVATTDRTPCCSPGPRRSRCTGRGLRAKGGRSTRSSPTAPWPASRAPTRWRRPAGPTPSPSPRRRRWTERSSCWDPTVSRPWWSPSDRSPPTRPGPPGLEVTAEASPHTIDGLVDAVVGALAGPLPPVPPERGPAAAPTGSGPRGYSSHTVSNSRQSAAADNGRENSRRTDRPGAGGPPATGRPTCRRLGPCRPTPASAGSVEAWPRSDTRLRRLRHPRAPAPGRRDPTRVDDLVAPLFVADGIAEPRPVPSLPGVVQHTVDSLAVEVKRLGGLGVPGGHPVRAAPPRGQGRHRIRRPQARRDHPAGPGRGAGRGGRLGGGDGRLLPRRVHRSRPLRRGGPGHRRGGQRRHLAALRRAGRVPGHRRGRRDRPERHDGRAGGRHPGRARRGRIQRHGHPGLRGQVRLGPLRPVPRRGRRDHRRRRRPAGATSRTRPTAARRWPRWPSTWPRAPTW